MNQVDDTVNIDMLDSELIDVDCMDFSDDQTWLFKVDTDSGDKVDIIDWNLSCEWPHAGDLEYLNTEKELYELLDNILRNEVSTPDRHKFDSRTFVRPKRRVQRPSLQNVVESSDQYSEQSGDQSGNKFLTYNKYNPGGLGPILRLKTFNVDTNSDNSAAVKEYAMKRRSLQQEDDDDTQFEDIDATLVSDASGRLSGDPPLRRPSVGPAGSPPGHEPPSRPIQIDLSQPAHNLHNTFNKGMSNFMNDRSSLSMFRSGESLMRMSPPSLVSSVQLEGSGHFHQPDEEAEAEGRELRPPPGRESIDPMMTSMTLSILDEKDMSTSFLSQSTCPEHESFLDSQPPSLVSSVNSSFIVPSLARSRSDSQHDTNIFSSATFTHLEQSERLLAARPRHQMYNSYTKRDSGVRSSESYIKSRDEPTPVAPREADETITLHYANNKFRKSRDAEKENVNSSFETDDAFYRDMGVHRVDLGRNSLNVTLNKQELNEIIQARQKLSLARRALPAESERSLPNQAESPPKVIQLPNQTITVPRQSMENASELLSRRRATNGHDAEVQRKAPERNATFKKSPPRPPEPPPGPQPQEPQPQPQPQQPQQPSPGALALIDIDGATAGLLDPDRTLQQEEWGSQERAMGGSSSSTDTGTFSSCSPPEPAAPPAAPRDTMRTVASTPLAARRGDLLQQLHHNISPIYDVLPASQSFQNETHCINSATIVRKHATAKRDILAGNTSLEPRMQPPPASPPRRAAPGGTASQGSMLAPAAPALAAPRRSALPASKLRQYSSHKELSRIPGSNPPPRAPPQPRGAMARRPAYASNPALSPTGAPPYNKEELEPKPIKPVAPPALVRQGTETLRRERPLSQLVAPRDLRAPPAALPAPSRTYTHLPPPAARAPPAAVRRPASGPAQRPTPAPAEPRPASGLPRPSRLPAPRRSLRPPSVYSVAPAADVDHY